MEVLVVGAGGREHALAWKLKQSPKVSKLFIAPGNAGTAAIGTNIPVHSSEAIIAWLKTHRVDLVVIGPDNFLAEGLTDAVQEIGVPVFGPTKAAAEIEWSKSFAKRLMLEENIPTAEFRIFSAAREARAFVRGCSFPVVIKADGLAAGKGVIIAATMEEADSAIESIMEARVFGDSGARVVIEEFLRGREISVHAFCDGERALLFPSSQDHKRIFDNDKGPNTGGMGTIAPVPFVSPKDMDLIRERIVLPALHGLRKRGRSFRGLLYPGIMLTEKGPKAIEFNARFGDPETQSYMRILRNDLFDVLLACASGSLAGIDLTWSPGYACCIVLASAGYPGNYEKGKPIRIPPDSEDIVVFHAGTARRGDEIITSGGRVLNITATGETLEKALARAYQAISPDMCASLQFRRDIGKSALRAA